MQWSLRMLRTEVGDYTRSALRLVTKCTKPTEEEWLKATKTAVLGFAALGGLGFVVKLIPLTLGFVLR